MLNTVTYGDAPGPPLLIAHGLFGSARNWGVLAKRLSEARRVIVVDMRNHGFSGWAATHSYEDMAADLAAVLDAPADVLGHSMGSFITRCLLQQAHQRLCEVHLFVRLVSRRQK